MGRARTSTQATTARTRARPQQPEAGKQATPAVDAGLVDATTEASLGAPRLTAEHNQVVDFADFKRQFPDLAGNFHHYPKILTLEKAPNALQGEVEISEKVHGSNLRLMVAPKGFIIGSRRMLIHPHATSRQPKATADYVRGSEWLALLRAQYPVGTVFYGEFYGKGLSRGMAYANQELDVRLFNIRLITGEWVSAHEADVEERHLVPLLATKTDPTLAELKELLPGSKIDGVTDGDKEGLVVKNYAMRDKNGNPVWAKIVRADFREDIGRREQLTDEELAGLKLSQVLVSDLVTDARCQKAFERASEGEDLGEKMDDMRFLAPALRADLEEECGDDIQKALAMGMSEDFFWKSASKQLAHWYYRLLKDAGRPPKSTGPKTGANKPSLPAAIKARKYASERFPSLLDEVDMLCVQHPGRKDLQLQSINELPEVERQAGLLILDGRVGEAEAALEKAALEEALRLV